MGGKFANLGPCLGFVSENVFWRTNLQPSNFSPVVSPDEAIVLVHPSGQTHKLQGSQGIGRDVPRSQRGAPMGNPYTPFSWVFMGYNPQESLENTLNTMGTLLGVHPIVP